jgi:hypothetical protein
MKGKFHTEEAVIPILLRKGIIVKEYGYDKNNNQVVVKEVGIPLNVFPGLRILGKLDFMRKQGWRVLKVSEMTDNIRVQRKKEDKEPFKKERRKKVISKMK